MKKQGDRFVGIEEIDGHHSSQLVPPRVAGGDEHLPPTAGQKRRQQLRILGIVIDQQPPIPIP